MHAKLRCGILKTESQLFGFFGQPSGDNTFFPQSGLPKRGSYCVPNISGAHARWRGSGFFEEPSGNPAHNLCHAAAVCKFTSKTCVFLYACAANMT